MPTLVAAWEGLSSLFVCVFVCLFVCLRSKIKTTAHINFKPCTGIVHSKSYICYVFGVKGQGHRVIKCKHTVLALLTLLLKISTSNWIYIYILGTTGHALTLKWPWILPWPWRSVGVETCLNCYDSFFQILFRSLLLYPESLTPPNVNSDWSIIRV